jgi:hypothetical protein
MKPEPGNVDGKVVETHEFRHAVEHSVNWSHVLAALVLLYGIWRLGPLLARDSDENR